MATDVSRDRFDLVAARQPGYPLARPNYGETEIAAVADVLMERRTTCGPHVQAFEQEFAELIGRESAVMVNSGSSADMLIAFGLGAHREPIEEILVPAITWPTHVWACLLAGYRVRLVDVDPFTLQFDVEDLRRKVTSWTRAIFPVHALGNVGDMDALREIAGNRPILEDCCEALGARWRGQSVGSFGTASAFSFFFSHILNTMEGGMVVCDADAAETYRLLRSHGWDRSGIEPYRFPLFGFNVRPTEVAGAFGLAQLARFEGFRAARARNYQRLADATFRAHPSLLVGVVVLPGAEPCWHGFPLLVRPPYSRDELARHLEWRGIETRPMIVGNLALQPAVRDDARVECGPLPGAQQVHERGMYIGLHSLDDAEGAELVGDAVASFAREHAA